MDHMHNGVKIMYANMVSKYFKKFMLQQHKHILNYKQKARLIYKYSEGERFLIISSVLLAVSVSISEIFSFGLLIPIMQSSDVMSGFNNVPVLKWFNHFFVNESKNSILLNGAVILLFFTFIRGGLLYFSELASYSIPWRLDTHLRVRVYKSLSITALSYVESLSAADQSDITASNPARIGIAMRFVALFISSLIIICVNILLMLLVSPFLTIAIISIMFVLSTVYKNFTSERIVKAGTNLTESTSNFSRAFYDTLTGMRVIRLSGGMDDALALVNNSINDMKEANLDVLKLQSLVGPFLVTAVGSIFCLVLIIAAALGRAENQLLIVSMIATIYFMSRLLGPLTLINVSRTYVFANLDAFEQMDKFFASVPQNIDADGSVNLEGFPKTVSFKNVFFNYSNKTETVVKSFNLTINVGEKIGIVGSSGSGKSTIIGLITRLYRPTIGEIYLDEIPLDQIKIQSWWSLIAVVTQDYFFSNISIRKNLVQGLSNLPHDDEIRRALWCADADGIIDALPNGLDTILQDRGIGLSGGERQRLSIARAILRASDFLIFDESTSNLDVNTEARILERISQLYPTITMLIIAHRLGALRLCDSIVVMVSGTITRTIKRNPDLLTGFPELGEILTEKPSHN